MEMALDLAERGRGFTSPNPMVGALLVRDGKVVGKGYHRQAGEPHAEVNAINAAGRAVKDATLYVSLEPCNHTGRTPPCTDTILQAGIRRVVVAMADPNPGVKGGGSAYLAQNGVAVTTGVCESRAEKLNEFFSKYITTRRPFVIVKCASTLDGRIATRSGDSQWVTGEAARAYVHALRHAVDAIMVGIGTVIHDDPSLTARVPGKETRDPSRIILDTHLRISESARLLHLDSNAGTLIICDNSVPQEKRDRIAAKNVEVMASRVTDGCIDLDFLMGRLGEKGITSLLIEGGSRVLASSFCDGIVDQCAFFYAPKILGGDDGVPICSGRGPDLMANCIRIKDINVQRFGDDILVEGYVEKEE